MYRVVPTNYRKFFKPALSLIKNNDFDVIHDLGCGNGNFLKNMKSRFKNKKYSGSDISKISIFETKKIQIKKLKLIQSNALNVKKWVKWLTKEYDPKSEKF